MNDLLLLEHVSKTFDIGKGGQVHAVRDVSFAVQAGRSVGLVGESGCGKSTIARMITGLVQPTAGKLFVDGAPAQNLKREQQREIYRKVQMVFQDPYSAISPRMGVGTFLEEGLVGFGMMSRKEAAREAVRLLEMVDLNASFADRLPHQLSGGQLQRVVIARAISIHPKLVILDEATSALDVSVQKQILSLLVRLQEQFHLTYLVIGHDLAVVRSITKEICVMKDGQIVEQLESRYLAQNAAHPYTKALLASVFSMRGQESEGK